MPNPTLVGPASLLPEADPDSFRTFGVEARDHNVPSRRRPWPETAEANDASGAPVVIRAVGDKRIEPPPRPPVVAAAVAADVAAELVNHVRTAHKASCENGGPMELLLREAIADAVRLADRLALLAQFAREGR